MRDEPGAVALPLRARATAWQLARFAVVGASGAALNLGTFKLAVHGADVGYRSAAVLAFVVAVSNNFLWNRRWTFAARDGQRGFQAPRFFAVSGLAFLFALGVLEVLVRAGVDEVPAQALAIVAATPLNFLGNKLWSFRGW